jgi:hypothetical protein
MGVGQRAPPGRSATGLAQPNNPLELTAHSAGFVGYSWRFLLWAAAQRERWAAVLSGTDGGI